MIISEDRIRPLKAIALLFATGFLSACLRVSSTPQVSTSITSNQARYLGDSIAKDLLTGDINNLHQKLESAFRDSVSDQQLKSILQQMTEVYGKPINFEFKQEEVGSKVYADGTTKAMRKLWYAAKTTKYETGSHFLIVEIVLDGDELFVASFAIVDFPLGVPDSLKSAGP